MVWRQRQLVLMDNPPSLTYFDLETGEKKVSFNHINRPSVFFLKASIPLNEKITVRLEDKNYFVISGVEKG